MTEIITSQAFSPVPMSDIDDEEAVPSYFDVMSQIKAAKSESDNSIYLTIKVSFILCDSCKINL
jgi:hypothetical protein